MAEQVYLSRRNLLSLLSKLDRKLKGEFTECTIIKYDQEHPIYPQSINEIRVTAVEDEIYYADRNPGNVLSVDDPNLKGKSWENKNSVN
jgi:hypothetical protein